MNEIIIIKLHDFFPNMQKLTMYVLFVQQAGLSINEIEFVNWEWTEELEVLTLEHTGFGEGNLFNGG